MGRDWPMLANIRPNRLHTPQLGYNLPSMTDRAVKTVGGRAEMTVRDALIADARALQSGVVLDRLAYSIKNLAKAIDLSDETIRQAIKAGELTPAYVGTKPLIMREEAERWLRSLPTERRAS